MADYTDLIEYSGDGTFAAPAAKSTLIAETSITGSGAISVPAVGLGYLINISGAGSISVPAAGLSHLINISGAGSISQESKQTLQQTLDIAGSGIFTQVLVYIFVDIDSFKVSSWSVSKNINDTLWKFSAEIDKHDVPAYFKNLRIMMPGLDRSSPPDLKDYCVFFGFIPGAGYRYDIGKDKVSMSGYDPGWFLSMQYIPENLTVTDSTDNPAEIVRTLLGEDNWPAISGIDTFNGNISDTDNWISQAKSFLWKFDTKKQKAISEICDYCSSLFHVKPLEIAANIWQPCGYFIPNDDIDESLTGFDLPDIEIFTNPDSYLVNITIDVNEAEKVNRVIVHGTNRETGIWKSKTIESSLVTSEEEIPREIIMPDYVPEPPPADDAALQTAVDAKAAGLYALFHTNATITIIKVRLLKRADLQLWQKVGFVGYADIPEYSAPDTNIMRIVNIAYKRSIASDIVEIDCIPDKDLSMDQARRMALGADYVSGQQDIITDMMHNIPQNEIGEVTAITGSVATVTLEKDGKSIDARILNP